MYFTGSSRKTPPETPRTWLAQWPQARRSLLANLFHSAVRAGASTPTAVVDAAGRELRRRLRDVRPPLGPTDTVLEAVLDALGRAPQDAEAYAQEVLAWEALPREVREQRKAERGRQFQQQYMAGQPVTARQKAFLRLLRYSGPEPQHRLEASELINKLQEGSR
jgi:hypothetical protein